ncbi:unnamed protein product [Amoebophrya sp. A25]|nr:unnamed protein product [Amoebophrya sp. A25]|eukprot:GSA25T00024675001.1
MAKKPKAKRTTTEVIKADGKLKNSEKKKLNRQAAAPLSKQLLADKSFGQNFLKNPGILDKIMTAADIQGHEIAFEIGPGTGNLTSRLLKSSKTVIAQEIDPRMVAAVQKRAQAEGTSARLTLRQGDCLKADWPPFHVLVANLPYQISSPFTFKLLAHNKGKWRTAVVMFQKEFAERLVAQPGEHFYGRLALNCRLFAKVQRVCKVDRNSFTPPPKVDSMVVKFTPVDSPIDVDFKEWDGLMRVVFSRKRKTLAASFRNKCILKILKQNFLTHFQNARGVSIFASSAKIEDSAREKLRTELLQRYETTGAASTTTDMNKNGTSSGNQPSCSTPSSLFGGANQSANSTSGGLQLSLGGSGSGLQLSLGTRGSGSSSSSSTRFAMSTGAEDATEDASTSPKGDSVTMSSRRSITLRRDGDDDQEEDERRSKGPKKLRGREREKRREQRHDDSTDDDAPAWKQKIKKPKRGNPLAGKSMVQQMFAQRASTSTRLDDGALSMMTDDVSPTPSNNDASTPATTASTVSATASLRSETDFNKIFLAYCVSILEEVDVAQKRAISMDLNEFLKLLLAFNRRGIHFSNVTDGAPGIPDEDCEMGDDDSDNDL